MKLPLLILVLASSAWGQIAFDAATQSGISGTSTLAWSHTTGSGTNRALVVAIAYLTNTETVSGCTYNSVSMTKVAESATYLQRVAILVLAAPATGANQVSCTFTGTQIQATAGSTTWTGVDQTTPNRTGYSTQSDTGTCSITVVNSASGDMIVDICQTQQASITVDASQTSRVEDDAIDGGSLSMGHSSESASGSSTVMSWTHTTGNEWVAAACALVPASAAARKRIISIQ